MVFLRAWNKITHLSLYDILCAIAIIKYNITYIFHNLNVFLILTFMYNL